VAKCSVGRKRSAQGARARAKREQQLELDWKTWGGPRRGAGRPKVVRSRVAHRTRCALSGREPVHVTTRVRAGLPGLRRRGTRELVLGVFRERCRRDAFRLVHFSIQEDHLHLIVEAQDRAGLAGGMRALLTSLARRLNRLWGRAGRVFERFHEHVLRFPREVRHAIRYVLGNSRHHGLVLDHEVERDPHSSGAWFDGWAVGRLPRPVDARAPVARARTWLLTFGWRRRGLLALPV